MNRVATRGASLRVGGTWVPLAWTCALAWVASGASARTATTPLGLVLDLVTEAGFWALLFGSGRALYQRWPPSLAISLPAFLAALALGGLQGVHARLFGRFASGEQIWIIRNNADVIVTEGLRTLTEIPGWVLPLAAIAGAAVFTAFAVRSRAPLFRPLLGLGGVHAVGALLWASLWVAPGLLPASSLPAVSGQTAARQLLARSEWRELVGPETREGPPGRRWALKRGVVDNPPAPDRASGPQPNLFVILLESVRADHLTTYGYPRETTPRLDAWVRRTGAITFEQAYANATLSYFSMVSLVTGLDLRHGRADFETAPLVWDQLAARGYDTFFTTLSSGYPRYGLDRFLQTPGLARYRDLGQEQLPAVGAERNLGARLAAFFLGGFHFDGLRMSREDRLTLESVRKELGSVSSDQPHAPFFGVWELESTHFRYIHPAGWEHFQPASAYAFSPENPEPLRNAYLNSLRYVDAVVGEMLDFLEASGLADDTVVIITSDHGEAFYEHGRAFHGVLLHPEQTRVPLLVRVPDRVRSRHPDLVRNLEANRRTPVQLADLGPTLIGFAEGSAAQPDPKRSDGVNLLGRIPERSIYMTNHPYFRREAGRPRLDGRVSADGWLELNYDDGRTTEHFPPPAPLHEAISEAVGG